jgi:hypothetical protein
MSATREWLPLDQDRINPIRTEDIGGERFQTWAAPHDVPVATRGYYDKASRKMVIEFRYSDDGDPGRAPTKSVALEDVTFLLDRRDNRMVGIEVDWDDAQYQPTCVQTMAERLQNRIQSAFTTLTQRFQRREANYGATGAAISEKGTELLDRAAQEVIA